MIQSDFDTASYLQDLAEEGQATLHGIEVLLQRFELPPLQQQALTEAASKLENVIHTIKVAK